MEEGYKVATILVKDAKDVRDISSILNSYDEDIDVKKGRYVIDGKSIIGLLMFTGMVVDVVLLNKNKSVAEKMKKYLKPWRVY